MKINYFQSGGSTPYRTAHPESAYNVSPETETLYDVIGPLSQRTMMDQAVALRNKAMQQPKPIAFNSVNDDQVIRGKFGNGQARIDALTAAGYDPKEVQAAVNARFSKSVTPKQEGVAPTVSSTPAPLQTEPSITTATMPFYDNNGQVAGEKTMYFGRGYKPTEQKTITSTPVQSQAAPQQTAPKLTPEQERYAALGRQYGNPERMQNTINALGKIGTFFSNAAANNRQYRENLQNREVDLNKQTPRYVLPGIMQYRKEGGSINYFQQGGQMKDPVDEVIQRLLQDPQGTMQALSQMQGQQGGKEQVNAILQEIVKRAKGGDQQAAQAVQVLQQAMQGGQQAAPQQAPAAKNGAKLNYLKQLKGKCPEGEELVYMKKGGVVCPVCQKKKGGEVAQENKKQFFSNDKKIKKHQDGGKQNTVTAIDRVKDNKNYVSSYHFPNGDSRHQIVNSNLPYVGYLYVNNGDSVWGKDNGLAWSYDTASNKEKKQIEDARKQGLTWKADTTKIQLPAELLFKEGGKMDKKEFFKKQPKAPIAKCGCKAKKKK